jgi:hypothetical protein
MFKYVIVLHLDDAHIDAIISELPEEEAEE